MVRNSDAFIEWFGDFVEVTGNDKDKISFKAAFDFYTAENETYDKYGLTLRGFCKKMREISSKEGFKHKTIRSEEAVSKMFTGIKIRVSDDNLNANDDSRF